MAFRKLQILSLSLLSVSLQHSFAQHTATLNEEQLFRRCYGLLTSLAPRSTHSQLSAVVNGTMTAIDACMNVLERGLLDTDGMLINNALMDEVGIDAKAVLRNFYNVHRTWFSPDNFTSSVPSPNFCNNTEDVYDDAETALHVTRALLKQTGNQFRDVFTAQWTLEAVRTGGVPNPRVSTFTNRSEAQFTGILFDYMTQKLFLERGELTGIKSVITSHPRYTVSVTTKDSDGSAMSALWFNQLIQNRNAGVLGTPSYFLHNSGRELFQKTNGGVSMHRRWSKKLFEDFFSRQLPVIRYSDAPSYVQPGSSISFRKGQGCMSCHASMDNLAKAVRNVSLMPTEENCNNDRKQTVHAFSWPVTLSALNGAEPDNDPDFYRRTPSGKLFFRTYEGVGVDVPYQNLGDLADIIANSNLFDDPYVAIAARYFKYFTGIEISLKDMGDPNAGLTAEQIHYRNIIIPIGRSLKVHQDLRRLIEDIMLTPVFRQADLRNFGE